MDKEVFVFEVNQKNFGQAVVLNSHKIPVLVEFMGVWSGPCVAMDLLFSNLAKEFPEKFIFAKVDIDEQPELGKEYKIENVPSLLVFKDGEVVKREVGELKEKNARDLLKSVGVFHESDLMREQAREKHLSGDTPVAIVLLTEAIKLDPSNTRVAMDMVQVFIDVGELEQANSLYTRLPESTRETDMGKAINGQLTFAKLAAKIPDIDTLLTRIETMPDDPDTRFDLAVRQISQYQYNEAVENLLKIFTKNSGYKDGAAKELLITISNMIEPVDSEFAQDIRRKIANISF